MFDAPRKRKIVFLTGTRADFGKIKSLLVALDASGKFDIHIFVTGMHMLKRYGSTWREVNSLGIGSVYTFINQNHEDSLDVVFAKTVSGFSDYVKEIGPDLVVVHGDRAEPLAGATVGALSGILVAHIEGGEVSGTVDELIRHAVTKLSHFHFVSNETARRRISQLGEVESSIYVIGSPEVDVINSGNLPAIDEVKSHYDLAFEKYSIVMFHPVTTELDSISQEVRILVDSLIKSDRNYIVILPNNDPGTLTIQKEYIRLGDLPNFRILPSMRFEYFLTLLKHADFMIGNSSSGVREAPHLAVPSINIGSRQNNRSQSPMITNSDIEESKILSSIVLALNTPRVSDAKYGDGNSAHKFVKLLSSEIFWEASVQKTFVDRT